MSGGLMLAMSTERLTGAAPKEVGTQPLGQLIMGR